MRKPLVQPAPPIYKINVTPIIDVALVLVIILLVTAPLLSVADLDITLPAARTRGAEDQNNLNITIGREGELGIAEDVVNPDYFQLALQQKLADPEFENALVVIRADAALPHSLVKSVMAQARDAGATRIALGTSQKNEDDR